MRPPAVARFPAAVRPLHVLLALAVLAVLANACSSGEVRTDGGADALPLPDAGGADGMPAGPGAVAHVPEAGAYPGTERLLLQDGAVIDTDALQVDGTSYPGGPGDGIVLDVWPQEPPGPELAVLHVHELGIAGGTVRVRGGRPLVIIASGEIRLAGLLDAGARGTEPGPGGAGPGEGAGAGAGGAHALMNQDGGGGGGGFGTAGAAGGSGICDDATGMCATGGEGGPAHGTGAIEVLAGGSGGGLGAAVAGDGFCPPTQGGAGGGAVQLTSLLRIRIDAGGGVLAGGGGGLGGTSGLSCQPAAGGGGGGSGGAIYLQAPAVEHRGLLAANGGGGGSGGNNMVSNPGSDGQPGDEPAAGGDAVDGNAFAGGCGDALAAGTCAREGGSGNGNGGGGGGGMGRIAITTAPGGHDTAGGTTSPEASVTAE